MTWLTRHDPARLFGPVPVAVAHRGGAAYAPNVGVENTRAAFARAVDLDYRVLETDVHCTADGALVALHDDVLDRVADRGGAIAELTLAEVGQARVGGREPVPAMAELLSDFPRATFVVDLKAEGTPRALAALLRRLGAEGRVCVGSFSSRRLWAFRWASRGRVATSAGPLGVAWLRFAPAWLSLRVHSPGIAYQVPVTHRVLGRELTVVTREFVAAAHAVGAHVHVWTVDDFAEMSRLLDLGVDGIVSDRIDLLRDLVTQRRGHWP